ncbi:MAG TPA: hypothetical protein VGV92_04240 [Gammaproteobacteria bacterium]|nr:hypothetical protein [Gammaproteobacteria bacterium]
MHAAGIEKNLEQQFDGAGQTVAHLFEHSAVAHVVSHRVSGTQNARETLIAQFSGIKKSGFDTAYLITTEMLHTKTLPLPVDSDYPEGQRRVNAFNELVLHLDENADVILGIETNFEILPSYQIICDFPKPDDLPNTEEDLKEHLKELLKKLKKPVHYLFIKENTAPAERYTLAEVKANIAIWAADVRTVLMDKGLQQSGSFKDQLEKIEEFYRDGTHYTQCLNQKAKEVSRSKKVDPLKAEEVRLASIEFQKWEAALVLCLAKMNKSKFDESKKQIFDCLMYSGGQLSSALREVIKQKIRERFRPRLVVYNDRKKIIEPDAPLSPKSGSQQSDLPILPVGDDLSANSGESTPYTTDGEDSEKSSGKNGSLRIVEPAPPPPRDVVPRAYSSSLPVTHREHTAAHKKLSAHVAAGRGVFAADPAVQERAVRALVDTTIALSDAGLDGETFREVIRGVGEVMSGRIAASVSTSTPGSNFSPTKK